MGGVPPSLLRTVFAENSRGPGAKNAGKIGLGNNRRTPPGRLSAMKRFHIPSAVALLLGIVMAIGGGKLPLHQNDIANRTDGEFITYMVLTAGGVLIALIAAFGLGRSSREKVGEGQS
jgi:hypothetical protein